MKKISEDLNPKCERISQNTFSKWSGQADSLEWDIFEMPVEALSDDLLEMFGLEPRKVRIRKLSPEELRQIKMEKFDEYEEIDSTVEE